MVEWDFNTELRFLVWWVDDVIFSSCQVLYTCLLGIKNRKIVDWSNFCLIHWRMVITRGGGENSAK